ncbi:hypothetical protein EGW08_015788, partial [Elysia chlorotica]
MFSKLKLRAFVPLISSHQRRAFEGSLSKLMGRSVGNSHGQSDPGAGPSGTGRKSIHKTPPSQGPPPVHGRKISQANPRVSSFPLNSKISHCTKSLCTTIMPPISENPKAEVQKLIEGSDFLIFSKSWCPFCDKAKDFLGTLSIKYDVVELDLIGEIY